MTINVYYKYADSKGNGSVGEHNPWKVTGIAWGRVALAVFVVLMVLSALADSNANLLIGDY